MKLEKKKQRIHFVPFFNGRGLLLAGLVSRKTLLTESVTGSLLTHNIHLLFGSHDHVGKGSGYKAMAKGTKQCHPQSACARRSVD